jgi:AmiR/NasT family two-component response regulator
VSTSGAALRVVLADEDAAALDELSGLVRGLGHEVIAREVNVAAAGEAVAEEDPDAALVVLHDDAGHALALIGEMSEYASGPVIALLEREDPHFVSRAADRGVAACARPTTPEAVQSALEIAVRRHAEAEALSEKVSQLETALGRRALIERAKGRLMERHGVDEQAAFELLRGHARAHNRTVLDVARAVSDGGSLPAPLP